jgi:hypothetical protein
LLAATEEDLVRLTSTVRAYLALADLPQEARPRAWTEQYEAAFRPIFDLYHSAWGRHERCLAAADEVPRLAPSMRAVERRAVALVERSERYFWDHDLLHDDLDVVLLVGGHTSNGWVADLDGRSTLFLALEFLGEPPYDAVLATHESLHVAHERKGAKGWPDDLVAGLFLEGLAVALSREVHPDLADTAYLWFDGTHTDWVESCVATASALVAFARDHLDVRSDDATVRWLFTTTEGPPGLPSRGGYWLGDLVVRRLLGTHEARELIGWDHASVRTAVERHLNELSH